MRNTRRRMPMSQFDRRPYYYRDEEDLVDNNAVHPDQVGIDEVLYLHSLWRQGPPTNLPRSEPISPQRRESKRRRSEPVAKPSKATKKKTGKRKKQRQEAKTSGGRPGKELAKPPAEADNEEGKPPADSASDEKWKGEWNTGSQPMDGEWNSTPRKNVETKPLSEEEELQFGQIKLQQKVLRTVKEFFNRGEDANSTEDDDDDDDDDDQDEEEDGDGNEGAGGAGGQRLVGKELEALNFFLKLFEDEKELAKYYEQSCNCGAFECLVCAGVGAKIGKRFPDCVSLIQHSMKILKTKKKAAHRGYGSAICKLLGWNPERLPSVVKPNELKPRGCIPPADEDEPVQEVDPVGEAAISKEAPEDAGGDADEATEDDEGGADEASADDEVDADEGTKNVEHVGQASD